MIPSSYQDALALLRLGRLPAIYNVGNGRVAVYSVEITEPEAVYFAYSKIDMERAGFALGLLQGMATQYE